MPFVAGEGKKQRKTMGARHTKSMVVAENQPGTDGNVLPGSAIFLLFLQEVDAHWRLELLLGINSAPKAFLEIVILTPEMLMPDPEDTMRKNPHTVPQGVLAFPASIENGGDTPRFTFLQLVAMRGMDRSLPDSSLLPHPMRSRTPGLGATPQFPVAARRNLADFFAARRPKSPAASSSRYDAEYQPAAIAAAFLHYPLA